MVDSKDKNPGRWFRRREVILPTWRGWLLFLVLLVALCALAARGLYPFLAVTDSLPGGVLVVEGWAPDHALKLAIGEFSSNRYEKVFVTGVPVDYGAPLSEYKTYAQAGAATLIAMGLDSNVVQAVPAPNVRQDRTYASALALRQWFKAHGGLPKRVNLMTEGPHARRSRLLYHIALGDEVKMGVIAVKPFGYDSTKWWRFSAGVRGVLSELIGYVYARLVFSPAEETAPEPATD